MSPICKHICLRELHAARQKQPSYTAGLTELHLGAVTVTATDMYNRKQRPDAVYNASLPASYGAQPAPR